MARFDWYEATVKAEPGELLDALLADFPEELRHEPLQRAPHGYGGGWRLLADGELAGQIWAGGQQAHPHVVFSGQDAHAGSEFLRTHFADSHFPSRIDPCEDFGEPEAYDQLQAIALQVAIDRKLKVDTRGDHLVTKQGRTLYLGSPKSFCRLRLYDKAAEMRARLARDPVKLLEVPEQLARLELQIRPDGFEARQIAARVDPISAFGCAQWTRELMRRVSGLDLEPVNLRKAWRQSDDDRAYAAMLAQYGGLLRRIVGDLGSWDCLGLQIGSDLAERAAAERKGTR